MAAGAQVVSRGRPHGKGANVTAAAEAALERRAGAGLVLLCDGDLGGSAAGWRRLVEAVEAGECDLAVAAFASRVGGGFGVALGFARWAIRRLCGAEPAAPISGQRAMRVEVLRAALPVRRRLRDGDRDDGRRGPGRLPAARVRARPRAPGDRPHRSRVPPPRRASCATSLAPTSSRRRRR